MIDWREYIFLTPSVEMDFVNLYSKRISGATLKIHLKVGFISQHFVKIVLEAIRMELIFG